MTEAGGHDGSTTLDGVLAALDAIIARSVETGDRVGYFAAMYRKVTAKVQEGIQEGFFDDAARMERLDCVFADRYLDAMRQFTAGEPPTRAWALAFEACADPRPIVVQHLLMGVNAHINLDLGIAAATVAPGDALPGLRRDFDRINEILAVQINAVESALGRVSPLIGLLDWLGGRNEEELIRFSIEVARTEAWRFATELAPLAVDDWGGPIGARDSRVAHLARVVRNPGLLLEATLLVIRAAESSDVRRVISVLGGAPEPALATVEQRVRQWRASDPGGVA